MMAGAITWGVLAAASYIRNYIGDTATNKAIRKTAVENPQEFFFFNNGISALAENVEPHETDKRILRCKNLSIVNGAQNR
jgi:hypothetical protein